MSKVLIQIQLDVKESDIEVLILAEIFVFSVFFEALGLEIQLY